MLVYKQDAIISRRKVTFRIVLMSIVRLSIMVFIV